MFYKHRAFLSLFLNCLSSRHYKHHDFFLTRRCRKTLTKVSLLHHSLRSFRAMTIRVTISFIGMAMLTLATTALAESAMVYDDSDNIFAAINNSLALSFSTMYFNYLETAASLNEAAKDINTTYPDLDSSLVPEDVKDSGWAFFGGALNLRNIFWEWLYTDITGEYISGKINYEGFTQFDHKPSSHRISTDFTNVDAKLGLVLLDTQYFQIIPYGGFGFRYIILGGHTYHNGKALFGTKINCALFEALVLSPYINIGTTLWPQTKSDTYDEDEHYVGKAKLNLGTKLIREIGLELNYRLDHDLFLTGMVSHTHFKYGKSAPQRLKNVGVVEPNSTTNELRFSIGIRYSFM